MIRWATQNTSNSDTHGNKQSGILLWTSKPHLYHVMSRKDNFIAFSSEEIFANEMDFCMAMLPGLGTAQIGNLTRVATDDSLPTHSKGSALCVKSSHVVETR